MPLALLAIFASPLAGAAGTAAGTLISNTADVSYVSDGAPMSTRSNTEIFAVDERVDLTLTWDDSASVIVASPDSGRVLSFRLTNTGNGSEGFDLAVSSALTGDDFDPAPVSIRLDSNGNGSFDAGDATYTGGTFPTLAANGSLLIFVLNDIPSGLALGALGDSQLTATARTGTGTGTVYAGQGAGGTDAVIGSSGGTAATRGTYAVGSDFTLDKSASIPDGAGGTVIDPAAVVSGTVVTYTLVLTGSGSGMAPEAILNDPIPAGTTYVPGSITLQGSPVTDAAGYTGSAVNVAIPAAALPYTRTVTFKVTVN